MIDWDPKSKKDDLSSARSEAAQFLSDLRRKDSSQQHKIRTAKELFRYITVSLKNEEQRYVEEFVNHLDTRDDQSAIFEGIYADDPDQRTTAIFLIVCLADSVIPGRVLHYANFLLKSLSFTAKSNEETSDLAARALVYLIQTSKSYSADLLEKALDTCQEWLQDPRKDSKNDVRRLGAVFLARELAMFTPTSFFLRASVFFRSIFPVIRDPQVNVRQAAIQALHAALSITSQREAKQKQEWYATCLNEGLGIKSISNKSKQDMHASLLILNELLRISDAEYEKLRLEANGSVPEMPSITEPIDWLIHPRFCTTVESSTARQLVRDNFKPIIDCVCSISSNDKDIRNVLHELYPRLCAFKSRAGEHLKNSDGTITGDIIEATDSHRLKFWNVIRAKENKEAGSALTALGLLVLTSPEFFRDQANFMLGECKAILTKQIKDSRKTVDQNVFVFLKLYVRAYGEKCNRPATEDIKALFPLLFNITLSKGLISLFHEITTQLRTLTEPALDGLIKLVYNKLTGLVLPNKIDPEPLGSMPEISSDWCPSSESDIVLALETLGSFPFARHSVTMCLKFVADGYLISEYSAIRLAAVQCCVKILKPFVKVYDGSHTEHKQWLLELVSQVLKSLITTAVIDPNVVVRQCVIKCFIKVEDPHLLSHLAQPHMLDIIFMALHDEKLEMQESTVSLLTLLSELNPALILPRLRRVLLETLSQLTNSGQARLEQHSARLLAQMATQNPKFVRPYMGPLLAALLPKLRSDITHVDVTIQVIKAISELCIVGGAEVVKSINSLFKMLTMFVSDSSSLQRREAALQCIGRICRATAYVVDPYRDYPTLLDDLLRLLKTEMSSSMRRQAIKVLGILGALDPYTHKVFTKTVQDSNTVTTALSLPMNKFDASDPLSDIIQWFNYERCTLEEYYPALTIANLMAMVQDEAYTQYYKEIASALMTIFRSLGDSYPQYVHQVVPRLIEVTKNCKGRSSHKEFFLIQLASLVSIIKSNSKPYLKQIFRLIADAWNEKEINKTTVVNVVEQIGVALGEDFAPYVCELIPYLLAIVQTDRDPERKITEKVLQCVKSLATSLSAHLQLIIPPVLFLIDEKGIPKHVRQQALETILHIAKSEDIREYAPRLMQCFRRNIQYTELQQQLMELLVELINQMQMQFTLFEKSVETLLRKYNLDKGDNYDRIFEYIKKSGAVRRRNEIAGSTGGGTQIKIPPPPPITLRSQQISTSFSLQQTFAKQIVNTEVVEKAWHVDGLLSKEDWSQWLIRLRSAFIKSGSSAAIRAAALVCDVHQHLAKELFNAAFMSVWTELPSGAQDEVTYKLTLALQTSEHNEVINTILNLAEFMDHSVKGPLPILPEVLLKSAEKIKAYAKALRYTENDIHKQERHNRVLTSFDCQQLITFANKLNVQEEAAGVVRYAEKHNITMQGRWYEKLNEWEKALETHQNEKQNPNRKKPMEEIITHELRCLEALGKWTEMNETAKTLHQILDKNATLKEPKILVMSARGAWAVGNFDEMQNYVRELTENSQEGSFLRAVLAVRDKKWSQAKTFIDKVRDMYDSELTSMASESYERAYGAMVQVQQLAELEEAMEYQMRPERRPRIALLWSRRLQGCRQNIEQWQRLLMLRSLVLSPAEMHPLRVKFASLCRQQGKMSMCKTVLRDLLNLPPNTKLNEASAPYDKPYLVMSLCKTLWADEQRGVALQTLDSLVSHLCRIQKELTIEEGRICAKACLKLGQWTEIYGIPEVGERNNLLNASSRYGLMVPIQTRSVDPYTGNYEPVTTISLHQYISQFQPQSLMEPSEQDAVNKSIVCYVRATYFDPKWHKAWHKLATAHLKAMSRELELIAVAKQREMERSLQLGPQLSPIPPLVPLGTSVYPHSGLPSPVPHQHVHPYTQTMPMSPHLLTNSPDVVHAIHAIRCFTMALSLAPGSRLENTLRLLQLWFQYGEYEEVYKMLRENIKGLPVETWLEVIPQLMARLDSSERMSSLIKQVIYELSKVKPQAIVYALTVASKSSNHNRKKNAAEMIGTMVGLHPRLVDEARLVSDELVRCAILWHEQWHDALDDASRLYFQEKNIKAMLDILKPLHEIIEKGPSTLKEQSFNQTYYADLADAYKFCQAYEKNKNTKELSQAWEIYCQIFKRIANQLRSLTSLDLNYISPLLMRAKDLELAVPGTYNPDPTAEVVRIESFGTHLQVINSKQRPRKMIIRGSDGHEYQFLLKGHEDPRQDERVMQLFGLVNTLLVNNSETCRRNLTIQRYSITSLSQNSGLIGWIPNCDTLHAMIKDYRDKKNISLSTEHKIMQQFAADTESLTLMQKLQVFQKALASNVGDDLRQILWLKSPSSEVWFDRRTNYTRSVACMSMVGYILGLGDRHPSNLMLDRLTGKIVHIDFGDCFDVAMTREKFPERVPFRLTRMLINAMEATGLEGTFRFTCEQVLKLLRVNKDGLLAVLEAFVYDPVINWRLLDGVKKDPQKREDDHVRRLPVVQQEAPRMMSEKVIDRIRQKLTGCEFGQIQGIEESKQIERLIEQATTAENLCQAYIGWCPFW